MCMVAMHCCGIVESWNQSRKPSKYKGLQEYAVWNRVKNRGIFHKMLWNSVGIRRNSDHLRSKQAIQWVRFTFYFNLPYTYIRK